jgi:tetratricopeptide (TPR) repeat protein
VAMSRLMSVVWLVFGVVTVLFMAGVGNPAWAVDATPTAEQAAPAAPIEIFHRGKVLSTFESGEYTYVKYAENGAEAWVAVAKTLIFPGDSIAFPDSPPMLDFQSKTLKMTFPSILFAPYIWLDDREDLHFKSKEDKILFFTNQFVSAKNFSEADRYLNENLANNPTSPFLHAQLANLYLAQLIYPSPSEGSDTPQDDIDKVRSDNDVFCKSALSSISKAIVLDGNNDQYYSKRATILSDAIYCNTHDSAEAMLDYDRALALKPGNAYYLVKKGRIYFELKDYPKMLDCASKANALHYSGSDLYDLYVEYYREKANYPKALEYVSKSMMQGDIFEIIFDAEYVDSIVAKTNRYEDAIKLYTEMIRLRPQEASFYDYRADYYSKTKQYKKAIADYSICIGKYPKPASTYGKRATCYYLDGDKQSALGDLKTACEREDQNACQAVPGLEAEIKRGNKWLLAVKSSSASYYYDRASIVRDKRNSVMVWVRGEITDKDAYLKQLNLSDDLKDKYGNITTSMIRYNVDCLNKEIALLNLVDYAEDGSVLRSQDTNQPQYNTLIPDSIGYGIYGKVCAQKTEQKPKKKPKHAR